MPLGSPCPGKRDGPRPRLTVFIVERLVGADEQRVGHRRLMRLACAQLEVKRVAATVTQNVNFRAPPTSGAPQSVSVGFVGVGIFFPRRRCSVQPGSMCHRYTTAHRAAHRRVRRAPASGTTCSRTFRRPPIDQKSSRPCSTVRTPSGCRATARPYEAPRTSRRAVRDDLEVADLSWSWSWSSAPQPAQRHRRRNAPVSGERRRLRLRSEGPLRKAP